MCGVKITFSRPKNGELAGGSCSITSSAAPASCFSSKARARAASSTGSHSGMPVEWHEASADKLPFPDASFDIVYCQLGLQFFADRAAALDQMRRVLADGGRLALMVWRGIEESPGFAALAEGLERHIGQAAANLMRAPFGLSNADELAALVRNAGFQQIGRGVKRPRFGLLTLGFYSLCDAGSAATSPIESH